MKRLKVGIVIGILLIAIISVASAWIVPPPPEPSEVAGVIFKNVTVEPTEGYAPLTVNITGEVCNVGNVSDDYVVIMSLSNESVKTDNGTLAPNECKSFSYNYTLTNNATIVLMVWSEHCICIPSDWYCVEITVLKELDEDHDGWNDNVEQLIHKYYPDFDPLNETPMKEDVFQAVLKAIVEYVLTKDPQIKEDVLTLINEYIEEYELS